MQLSLFAVLSILAFANAVPTPTKHVPRKAQLGGGLGGGFPGLGSALPTGLPNPLGGRGLGGGLGGIPGGLGGASGAGSTGSGLGGLGGLTGGLKERSSKETEDAKAKAMNFLRERADEAEKGMVNKN